MQLELRGIIESRYAYFAEYRFQYRAEPQAILAHFSGERLQFLQALLHAAPRAKTWCTLDFEALHQSYPAEHSRVVKALDYLAEQGWIELEAKQMTEVYAVLQPHVDAEALGAELSHYFKTKEASEVARIQGVLDLFASESCLSQRLATYFGDQDAPQQCGHCSVCLGQTASWPEPDKRPPLAGLGFSALCAELMARHQSVQGNAPSAELLTRFLCGISAPLLTRLKARSLSGFAALEDYPYAQVRAWVQDSIKAAN
ncbi:MAG: ATP-dependent DNA helicase RecQ [Comamonadaceae bacterium]|nr:MAG: ATP-dependent DNA helicase RecQ [Comamonadaceae bacterium]